MPDKKIDLDATMKEVERLYANGGEWRTKAWEMLRALPLDVKKSVASDERSRKTAMMVGVAVGMVNPNSKGEFSLEEGLGLPAAKQEGKSLLTSEPESAADLLYPSPKKKKPRFTI